MTNLAKAKHTIRIISGTHRSRRLPVLDFEGLRPTGDRLRETLFNWLQAEIVGKNVLDLCAGTGALGFEAASRGAKNVVMLEKNKKVAFQLKTIQNDFKFNNVTVINKTAQNFLSKQEQYFDIIFLDPPFAENLIQELTELSSTWIKPHGFLYREAGISQELKKLDDNWHLYRQKCQAQVKIELWQKLA